MVPSKWKLDHATIDQLIASPEAGQALELLGSHYYYHHIFAGSRQKFEDTKSLSFLELALREYLIHLSKRVFLGFPYSVGIIFAFLLLKENEARNLSAILTGVEAGLAPETIRSNLALEH
jgi:vacuolar-type H+-ATPase subunit C/Vma6